MTNKNASDKNNTGQKEQFTVKDIIIALNDVDNKILSLHECSTEDFMTFNSYLKKYNTIVETISENAQKVFHIISGKNNCDSYQELKSFHSQLKKHTDYFEDQINQSITLLEKLLHIFDLLFVPLKNFNQNLMTLKFLNANLKFHALHFNTSSREAIENNTNSINKLITNIKNIYPVIDAGLFQLKGALKSTLIKLRDIKKRNIANVGSILHRTEYSIKLLSTKHSEALAKSPELKKRTENYSDSINKIITNLQYHDIIRQKIEHIQKSHKEILAQLSSFQKESLDNVSSDQHQQYLLQIRDITGLQVAQLIETNRQYQSAIEVITKKYLEISDDLNEISSMCLGFSIHTHRTDETHFSEIETKLQNAISIIQELSNANQDFKLEIQTISNAIERIVKQFGKIKEFDQQLLTVISVMVATTANLSDKNMEHNEIISQIQSIAGIIQKTIETMLQLFNQSTTINTGLQDIIAGDTSEIRLDNIHLELSNKLHIILSNLNDSNYQIRTILSENSSLSDDISTQVKASIEQVKYYDFFEQIIEEIIIQLNNLYMKLLLDDDSENRDMKRKNIEIIQKHYTTRSERNIHESYLEKSPQEKKKKDDENDIELF